MGTSWKPSPTSCVASALSPVCSVATATEHTGANRTTDMGANRTTDMGANRTSIR